MARLLLIRHALTSQTGRRLTGRLPGVGLDQRGREQAEAVARLLGDLPVRAVYTSPLERTMETAAIVARPHGLEPVPHDGLVEVDYGRWAGRTLGSLRRLAAWKAVVETPSRVAFPDGETLRGMQQRMVGACEDIAAAHRGAMVAIVTHADPIKAVLSHFLGQPLDLFQRIAVAPASVSLLDLPRSGAPVVGAIDAGGWAWRS